MAWGHKLSIVVRSAQEMDGKKNINYLKIQLEAMVVLEPFLIAQQLFQKIKTNLRIYV